MNENEYYWYWLADIFEGESWPCSALEESSMITGASGLAGDVSAGGRRKPKPRKKPKGGKK